MRALLLLLRRATAQTGVRLGLFAALALAGSWTPLSQVGGVNDFRDAHLLSSYDMAAARTVREYGQLPLWDPWACGGMYGLGSPQTRFASPTLLLSVVFGPRRAEGLMVFAFMLLGLEGAFRFLRLRVRSALGATLAAPLFALNGYFLLAWSLGWVAYMGFELLPWALLGVDRLARGRVSGGFLVAGAFAVMTGFGGVYTAPLCGIAAAAESLRAIFGVRGAAAWRRAALLVGAAAVLAVGACAFRLWPIAESLASAPRVIGGRPAHGVVELFRMAFWATDGDTDMICFMGPAALLALGAWLRRRRAAFPAAVAALLVWIASGYAPSFSSFEVLRSLPVFDALRYPERFLLPASLFIAELAAGGFAGLLVGARKRRALAAVCALGIGLAVGGACAQVAADASLARRSQMTADTPSSAQPFAQARGNRWASDYFVAMNRGSLSCGEAYPVPMSERLRGDLPHEEYLADPSAGAVREVAWSPNRIEAEVSAQRPTELLVNQNWHPGWRASGGEVFSQDGLLGVRVPAGVSRVVLRFWPRSGVGGALVSISAFAGWLAAWALTRKRWRPWPVMAAAVAPFAIWGALAAGWKQAPMPPLRLNPDGAPIVVDALPFEARPIHARWAEPIELLGAVLPSAPGPDHLVHFQFYWRVDGPVENTLGIFVHLEAADGTRKSADHEPIAGSYFPHRAPRAAILRDDFAADTSDYAAGRWDVKVGLWRARGDTSRLAVQDTAGNPVSEDRLTIGSFVVPPAPDAGVDAGR